MQIKGQSIYSGSCFSLTFRNFLSFSTLSLFFSQFFLCLFLPLSLSLSSDSFRNHISSQLNEIGAKKVGKRGEIRNQLLEAPESWLPCITLINFCTLIDFCTFIDFCTVIDFCTLIDFCTVIDFCTFIEFCTVIDFCTLIDFCTVIRLLQQN